MSISLPEHLETVFECFVHNYVTEHADEIWKDFVAKNHLMGTKFEGLVPLEILIDASAIYLDLVHPLDPALDL